MKTILIWTEILVILILLSAIGCNDSDSWGWKRSQDPDDVMNFLNGQGAYSNPVKDARISVVSKDNYYDFIVNYCSDRNSSTHLGWDWKKATSIDDAYNFVNGKGDYTTHINNFQFCGVWKESYLEFYIFYQRGQSMGTWSWKLATSLEDAQKFLNGDGSYTNSVKAARIASINKGSHIEYYIFYQRASAEGSIDNWLWKKSYDPDDAMRFLNGTGSYSNPVKGFDVCAVEKENSTEYIVFHNKGTKIWAKSPLSNERFVKDEFIEFKVILTGDHPKDESQLKWNSSIDGDLGSGEIINLNNLSVGNHSITVSGYHMSESIPIRIYNDLWELYQTEPSQSEIDRIMNDFQFHFVDGTGDDESWVNYNTFEFDQSSINPSKVVVICKIDILRHQRFSKESPFTPGMTFYQHLKQHINDIYLQLDCGYNTGGGNSVRLNRNFSVWDGRSSGTSENPEACKTPHSNVTLYKYISPLYLLMHEARHSEPTDPGHTSCNDKSNMDPYFENGSGHSSAALYLMWVYKYGLYDPLDIKNEASNITTMLLNNRFCEIPTHSNEYAQVILDELIQP